MIGDDIWKQATTTVAWSSAVHLFITFGCIFVSWWVLQQLKIDLFIRHPHSLQGRMVYILLAIVVGRMVAQFFIDYWSWMKSLMFWF